MEWCFAGRAEEGLVCPVGAGGHNWAPTGTRKHFVRLGLGPLDLCTFVNVNVTHRVVIVTVMVLVALYSQRHFLKLVIGNGSFFVSLNSKCDLLYESFSMC